MSRLNQETTDKKSNLLWTEHRHRTSPTRAAGVQVGHVQKRGTLARRQEVYSLLDTILSLAAHAEVSQLERKEREGEESV